MHNVRSVRGIEGGMYLITNNSIENQLVMIFLRHRRYSNLGMPRIVSAKYEVILSLATMFVLFDKFREEEEEGEEAAAKNKMNNFKEVPVLSYKHLKSQQIWSVTKDH